MHGVYQVISAYSLKHDANEEMAYQSNFQNESEFKNFVDSLLQRSFIKINADISYDRQILTLSTCVNHSSSRFIVHAIRFN